VEHFRRRTNGTRQRARSTEHRAQEHRAQSSGGGHLKCLKLLLDRGANPDQSASDGQTAAHLACATGEVRSLQLLISAGVNLNAKDGSGFTPMDYARRFKCQECIELLLENKVVGDTSMSFIPFPDNDEVR
jgi:ankyrin repeat protein